VRVGALSKAGEWLKFEQNTPAPPVEPAQAAINLEAVNRELF
jgi:hypothetical protein